MAQADSHSTAGNDVWADPRVRSGIERQRRSLDWSILQGRSVAGWKVGFNSLEVRKRWAIPAPLVGYILSQDVLANDAVIELRHWSRPVAEPEIAVVLRTGLHGGASRADAASAIAQVGPAIELVDVGTPPAQLEEVLESNIFHRGVVLGPLTTYSRELPLADLRVRVLQGQVEAAHTNSPAAMTGDVLDLVIHTAAWLEAAGLVLEPGHAIITGSTTAGIHVESGDDLLVTMDRLGEARVSFT